MQKSEGTHSFELSLETATLHVYNDTNTYQ